MEALVDPDELPPLPLVVVGVIPHDTAIAALVLSAHPVQGQFLLHHLEVGAPDGDVARHGVGEERPGLLVGEIPAETDHDVPADGDGAGEDEGLAQRDVAPRGLVDVRGRNVAGNTYHRVTLQTCQHWKLSQL